MTDISFSNYCDRINGKCYTDGVPEPVEYELAKMDLKNVGGAELTPLSDEDMATHSRDDVVKEMEKMKQAGYNPTRLGEPMTDSDFKKFMGQTWQ